MKNEEERGLTGSKTRVPERKYICCTVSIHFYIRIYELYVELLTNMKILNEAKYYKLDL